MVLCIVYASMRRILGKYYSRLIRMAFYTRRNYNEQKRPSETESAPCRARKYRHTKSGEPNSRGNEKRKHLMDLGMA